MTWEQVLLLGLAFVVLAWLAARTAVAAAVERAIERKFREWEVRFSLLHTRRLDALEMIQEHLADTRAALESAKPYLEPVDNPAELQRHLSEATAGWRKASRTLASRRFYFPPATCAKLEDLLDGLKCTNLWAMIMEYGESSNQSEGFRRRTKAKYGELRDQVQVMSDEIDQEFRRLVGSD